MKMTPGRKRSRARQDSAWVRVPLVLAAAATAVSLAGCGSSKPAYCTDRTNLQNSVKGLASSGVSGLKSQLKQIQTDATTLVNSAKSDFPNETTAIDTAVSSLQKSIKGLSSSPTPGQLAAVGLDIKNTVTSVSAFVSASKSKCS